MIDVIVTTKKTVTKEMLTELFTVACEGGINYWCASVTPTKLTGDCYESMIDGFTLITKTGRKEHKVDEEDIENACQILAKKYPERLENIIDENYDAEDADVFMQLCVFKEVVFA